VVGAIVLIGIILVVAAGFWLTRGAGGPPPLDAEGRNVDTTAHISPLGEPMSFDDDLKSPDG
jgi:hypothetical protein